MRLHRVPTSIVSDRDSRLSSRFWLTFLETMRSSLRMSLIHHSQTNGQLKRTIQTLEDYGKGLCLESPCELDEVLPLWS